VVEKSPLLSQLPAHWPRRPDLDRDTSLHEMKPDVLITHPAQDELGFIARHSTDSAVSPARLCVSTEEQKGSLSTTSHF